MRINEVFNLKTRETLDNATVPFFGIECEIESIDGQRDVPGFTTTEDGSLRNNGLEYVSHPMEMDDLIASFEHLHEEILVFNPAEKFSSRTSTHVHVNCRSLNTDQIRQMVLFYAMFEEFFFLLVDKDRRTNIHCVPLTETFLPVLYNRSIKYMHNSWHKYTALNVLPVSKLGTIEFRHLQGTDDERLVAQWVKVLSNLWYLAKDETITPKCFEDKDCVKRWFHSLFGHVPKIMALEPAMDDVLSNSMLDVKFAFV